MWKYCALLWKPVSENAKSLIFMIGLLGLAAFAVNDKEFLIFSALLTLP